MPETTAKPKKPRKTAQEAKTPVGKGVDTGAAQKAAKKPKKTGRPSKYDPEIARIICEQLSEGIPLRQICRENDGFPAWRTVYDWMAKDDALGSEGVGLSASIARARDIGYDAIAEECLQIADNPQFGQKQVMTDQGTATTVEDMLGHRKLQIETRLKLLAKFHPTKYGEKVQLGGDGANPIKLEVESQAEKMMAALLQNIELKRQSESS